VSVRLLKAHGNAREGRACHGTNELGSTTPPVLQRSSAGVGLERVRDRGGRRAVRKHGIPPLPRPRGGGFGVRSRRDAHAHVPARRVMAATRSAVPRQPRTAPAGDQGRLRPGGKPLDRPPRLRIGRHSGRNCVLRGDAGSWILVRSGGSALGGDGDGCRPSRNRVSLFTRDLVGLRQTEGRRRNLPASLGTRPRGRRTRPASSRTRARARMPSVAAQRHPARVYVLHPAVAPNAGVTGELQSERRLPGTWGRDGGAGCRARSHVPLCRAGPARRSNAR